MVTSKEWSSTELCFWSSFVCNIYINDLDEGVRIFSLLNLLMTLSFLVKYQLEDAEKLQKDLSTLNEWSTEWSMLFNTKNANVYIIDTTINSMTILWEMNAL